MGGDSYKPGDVLWVRYPTYPAWAVRVMDHTWVKAEPAPPGHWHVMFFNDDLQTAVVTSAMVVKKFKAGEKAGACKMTAKESRDYFDAVQGACEEADDYVRRWPKRAPDGWMNKGFVNDEEPSDDTKKGHYAKGESDGDKDDMEKAENEVVEERHCSDDEGDDLAPRGRPAKVAPVRSRSASRGSSAGKSAGATHGSEGKKRSSSSAATATATTGSGASDTDVEAAAAKKGRVARKPGPAERKQKKAASVAEGAVVKRVKKERRGKADKEVCVDSKAGRRANKLKAKVKKEADIWAKRDDGEYGSSAAQPARPLKVTVKLEHAPKAQSSTHGAPDGDGSPAGEATYSFPASPVASALPDAPIPRRGAAGAAKNAELIPKALTTPPTPPAPPTPPVLSPRPARRRPRTPLPRTQEDEGDAENGGHAACAEREALLKMDKEALVDIVMTLRCGRVVAGESDVVVAMGASEGLEIVGEMNEGIPGQECAGRERNSGAICAPLARASKSERLMSSPGMSCSPLGAEIVASADGNAGAVAAGTAIASVDAKAHGKMSLKASGKSCLRVKAELNSSVDMDAGADVSHGEFCRTLPSADRLEQDITPPHKAGVTDKVSPSTLCRGALPGREAESVATNADGGLDKAVVDITRCAVSDPGDSSSGSALVDAKNAMLTDEMDRDASSRSSAGSASREGRRKSIPRRTLGSSAATEDDLGKTEPCPRSASAAKALIAAGSVRPRKKTALTPPSSGSEASSVSQDSARRRKKQHSDEAGNSRERKRSKGDEAVRSYKTVHESPESALRRLEKAVNLYVSESVAASEGRSTNAIADEFEDGEDWLVKNPSLSSYKEDVFMACKRLQSIGVSVDEVNKYLESLANLGLDLKKAPFSEAVVGSVRGVLRSWIAKREKQSKPPEPMSLPSIGKNSVSPPVIGAASEKALSPREPRNMGTTRVAARDKFSVTLASCVRADADAEGKKPEAAVCFNLNACMTHADANALGVRLEADLYDRVVYNSGPCADEAVTPASYTDEMMSVAKCLVKARQVVEHWAKSPGEPGADAKFKYYEAVGQLVTKKMDSQEFIELCLHLRAPSKRK